MITVVHSEPVVIDAALVRGLVAAQFPRWADLPVTPVPAPGVDNATLRLGADMLVRLPRFARWVGQVHREQRWLPVLAPHLPLPVPEPLAQGEPTADYPFPWSVYRWLDGQTLSHTALDLHQAARDLAGFLLALQRIDVTDGPPPEWSNGFRGCAVADPRDSPITAERLRARIEALRGLADTAALTEVWQAGLDAPAWDRPPVWVHGDPDPRNLLAKDGRLSAVIDFGTLAVGDPAVDLIPAWSFLDTDARVTFRAALGVDEATWARGRVWGLSAVLPDPDELAPGHPDAAANRRRLDELVAG
ncbi:aminoglycoside phosphotransferase family protein [Crossiella sp. CA-258035]|uniref:aminoglycoside phosphotransferase family protein n=1 Tax=Crossiella sp. CA-258035 TaxID=2981138 RepID=UPI0024BD420B|nr:aminoglycoside phosphotransferase family protein [Crossiella sp. CA-258035]WHT22427.1 aminoglycoside phosphotransferase family protein [Crossiella sp. CA-258035]